MSREASMRREALARKFAGWGTLNLRHTPTPPSPPHRLSTKSGHYVWPAAPVLCRFLIKNWASMPHGAVLELGAGCGLGGLVTAALPGTTAVVMTDHDPGARSARR